MAVERCFTRSAGRIEGCVVIIIIIDRLVHASQECTAGRSETQRTVPQQHARQCRADGRDRDGIDNTMTVIIGVSLTYQPTSRTVACLFASSSLVGTLTTVARFPRTASYRRPDEVGRV